MSTTFPASTQYARAMCMAKPASFSDRGEHRAPLRGRGLSVLPGPVSSASSPAGRPLVALVQGPGNGLQRLQRISRDKRPTSGLAPFQIARKPAQALVTTSASSREITATLLAPASIRWIVKTFDINEAADFLKIDRSTALELAKFGALPGAKVGRAWVFMEDELVAYLRDVTRKQTQARRATCRGGTDARSSRPGAEA